MQIVDSESHPGLDLAPAVSLPACRMLEVVSHLDPRLGGMSTVIPRLAAELAENHPFDVELCVFGQTGPGSSGLGSMIDQSTWPTSRLTWCRSAPLRDEFRNLLGQADGVHIHGLWETSSTVAARLSRAVGKPYIVSAHGMLEPWALANKAMKKRIYAALLERTNLAGAACLHALTNSEAEDYRRFGCRQPIAVIPNGVDAPDSADASLFLRRFPQLAGKRIILFLGRIHFKKGLDLLVPAWGALAREFPDAVLVLAGPDSENSLATVKELIEQHGLHDRVVCTGMLDGDLKWSALAASTAFVLPSYSEGLSVAVLEALSMRLPVIVSEQCHIPEIEGSGAGWVVKTNVESLERALRALLKKDASGNAAMGRRARELANSYQWRTVAGKMAELYQWVTGGPCPRTFDLLGVDA